MTALHSRRMKTDAPYFRQWHSSAQNKPKPREFLFTTESIVENNSRFSLRLGRTWNIVWPGKIRCRVFDCTKKTICPPSLRYHPPSLHFSWASSSFDNFIALSDSADCASITHKLWCLLWYFSLINSNWRVLGKITWHSNDSTNRRQQVWQESNFTLWQTHQPSFWE